MVSANVDFGSGHNRDVIEYLTDSADVILLQEAKDFTLADLLPAGWRSLQDTSSEAKAGACIGVRTDAITVARSWLVKGCDPPPGGGMLPRWIAVADVRHPDSGEHFTAISAHDPPPRYSSLQPGYDQNLAKVCQTNPNPIVGADANQDIDGFARKLGPGMKAYGKQSGICLVTAGPLEDVDLDSWPENYGASDHPCIWGSLGVPG